MGARDKAGVELWHRWRQLNAAGRYEEAIQAADQMLALAEPDSIARSYAEESRRIAAANLQRLTEAETRFRQILTENPQSDQAWMQRGMVLLELDLHEAAAQSFEEALSLNPRCEGAWIGLGIAKSQLEQESAVDEALRCFDRAIEIDPLSDEAWFQKGLLFSDRNRRGEALQCLDRVIQELNPNHHWAWYAKGLELAAAPRNDAAMLCFVRALQLDPESESAWSCHNVRLQANS